MSLERFTKRVAKRATTFAEGVVEYVTEKRTLYQLSAELSAANEHLDFLFAELGRLRYHGSAALAGVREELEIREDIRVATEDIAEIEVAMAAFLAKEENKSDAPSQSANTSLYCHKCGTPQTEANDFCPKCGTHLNK